MSERFRDSLVQVMGRARRDRHPEAMQFTARVALPRLDESRADAVLRSNLREQAAGYGYLPDWSTLEVSGPVEVAGASGHVW